MSGPSWLIGKGIKEGMKALGADPITATVVARGVHIASSTVFHDHHTHFHPYGDEASDVQDIADSLSDSDDTSDSWTDLSTGNDSHHLASPRSTVSEVAQRVGMSQSEAEDLVESAKKTYDDHSWGEAKHLFTDNHLTDGGAEVTANDLSSILKDFETNTRSSLEDAVDILKKYS